MSAVKWDIYYTYTKGGLNIEEQGPDPIKFLCQPRIELGFPI